MVGGRELGSYARAVGVVEVVGLALRLTRVVVGGHHSDHSGCTGRNTTWLGLKLHPHQIALQYPHKLGDKGLQVKDDLCADMQPVLVESRPLDDVGLQCVIDAVNQTERQKLKTLVRPRQKLSQGGDILP